MSWLTARTSAGTSARTWASSLFLLAIVCRSFAMVARSRASFVFVVGAAVADALVGRPGDRPRPGQEWPGAP
ncbi:MAG TPA: hypothetical protein VMI73_16765 [Trebonia sp.]|nr:hypothetical protein [Trebonia sp.]